MKVGDFKNGSNGNKDRRAWMEGEEQASDVENKIKHVKSCAEMKGGGGPKDVDYILYSMTVVYSSSQKSTHTW